MHRENMHFTDELVPIPMKQQLIKLLNPSILIIVKDNQSIGLLNVPVDLNNIYMNAIK